MATSKPRRFHVSAEMTITIITEVEATSKRQAIAIASECPVMALCHQCAGSDGADREWRTSGELDGVPRRMCATADDE